MPIFNNNFIASVDIHPGFKPGNYYLHTPFCPTTTNTATALLANTLCYTPLFLPKKVAIDRLGIRTIVAVPGSLTRIGIYNNSSQGLPTNLLLDAGELDTSSINFKEAIINSSLDAGWYWLAGNCNLSPNLQTPTAYFGSLYYLGLSGPQASSNNYAYYQSSVLYGALPSTAPISTLTAKSNFPLFWFRVA